MPICVYNSCLCGHFFLVVLCVCTLLLHRKLSRALVTVSLTSASFQLSGKKIYIACVCVFQYV